MDIFLVVRIASIARMILLSFVRTDIVCGRGDGGLRGGGGGAGGKCAGRLTAPVDVQSRYTYRTLPSLSILGVLAS